MAEAGANAVMVVNPSYFKNSMTVSITALIIS
jgi:dihydrodipicolinate synthase/N-acetylneuraminate lyase